MTFVHDDPEFADLLRIVARHDLEVSIIEKEYWVTHALWALHARGFEVWFKGGTSPSKGFGLIRRFSEDLDLKVEPDSTGIPAAQNWRSEGMKATAARRGFLEALASQLRVPGAKVVLDHADDPTWRNARLLVRYPRTVPTARVDWMRPFVLLEVGDARVTPFVPRDLGSLVHDELERLGRLGAYTENRPRGVRCVHPFVTLMEKLDALQRRVAIEANEPAAFVVTSRTLRASSKRTPASRRSPTTRTPGRSRTTCLRSARSGRSHNPPIRHSRCHRVHGRRQSGKRQTRSRRCSGALG